MSIVTSILICGLDVEEKAEEINKWLESKDHFGVSHLIAHGGEKPFNTDILEGSFNNLNLDGFIDFLKSIEWKYSTDLFFLEEDDVRFTRKRLCREEVKLRRRGVNK